MRLQKDEVSDLRKKIRILQIDTLHLPNSFCDGYSTTSEATCAAAQQACVVLVQRLLPVKEELAKAHPNGEVSWESICFTVLPLVVSQDFTFTAVVGFIL